jgi:hypothetical protein
MSKHVQGFDAETGVYSYKKDGSWFFSTCPPEQVQSKRVDGKWYFIETCGGSGGDGTTDLSAYSTTSQMKAADASTLADAKSYADEQIDGLDISVDLSDYATTEWVMDQGFIDEQPVTDGDAATLASANEYTDSKVAAIEIPEGADLSGYAETTYVDGADQAVQRFATTADEAVLAAAKKYTDDSQGPDVATNVMVTDGEQDVESGWKLMSGGRTLISVGSSQVGLYHVKDPTDNAHPVTRGFADARYQFIQKQIVFKCDQYAACSTSPNPAPGEFCGLNNSSPGSPTSPNPYFGNWNDGIRVSTDKLLNPEGNEFADMERYTIEGTVTILDKNGKLYFKAAASSVSRTNNNSYVTINFGSRVPAFGTGAYNDTDQYVLIVEGLESVQPATTNIPED